MSKNIASAYVLDDVDNIKVPLPPLEAIYWSSIDTTTNSTFSSNKIRLLDFHYTLPLVVCADKDNHLIIWYYHY